MFYRRRSVFCRLGLNSKTFTHTAFLTHANHATHAKISTHVTHAKILWTHATHTKISTPTTYVTHAKMLWTHATHATHAPTPPMRFSWLDEFYLSRLVWRDFKESHWL